MSLFKPKALLVKPLVDPRASGPNENGGRPLRFALCARQLAPSDQQPALVEQGFLRTTGAGRRSEGAGSELCAPAVDAKATSGLLTTMEGISDDEKMWDDGMGIEERMKYRPLRHAELIPLMQKLEMPP